MGGISLILFLKILSARIVLMKIFPQPRPFLTDLISDQSEEEEATVNQDTQTFQNFKYLRKAQKVQNVLNQKIIGKFNSFFKDNMKKQKTEQKIMGSSKEANSSQDLYDRNNLLENSTNQSFSTPQESSIKRKRSQFSIKNLKRFIWQQKFAKNVQVDILQTNFQSMKIQIHLGNYKLFSKVIFTKIKAQTIFTDNFISAGVFGNVFSLNFDNFQYAIKVVKIKTTRLEWNNLEFYKQYFLCCLADELGVGPSVYSLFGYDMVFLQNSGIFCMQKCVQKKSYKLGNMKTQLSESLNILHQNNFVHLDIKPDNISYSQIRQKHIFLDFGLSKIIIQQSGQKTLTRFLGTLNFCSEEMKKCYILQHEYSVDLYLNDKFALNKTIEAMNFPYENKDFEKMELISTGKKQPKQKPTSNLLSKIVLILNLKFQIQQNNVNKIITILQQCQDVPLTCFQILSFNRVHLKNNSHHELLSMVQRFRKSLTNPQNTSQIDQKIFSLIEQKVLRTLFLQFIPISQILKTSQSKFENLLQSNEWMNKIFFTFNPLRKENYTIIGNIKIRNQIIEKIFRLSNNRQFNQHYPTPNPHQCTYPNFICFKTEFVLLFFYQKIRKLKNSNLLIQLRILLLATMSKLNEELLKTIENQILQNMENENERIITLIQFYLFWNIYYFGFPFKHVLFESHYQKIQTKPDPNDMSHQFTSKLKYTLFLIFQKQDFFNLNSQFQQQTKAKIKELIEINPSRGLIETLAIIQNLYHFIVNQKCVISLPSSPNSITYFVYIKTIKFFNPPHFDHCNIYSNFSQTFMGFTQEYKNSFNTKDFIENQIFLDQFKHFQNITNVVGLKEVVISNFAHHIQINVQSILQLSRLFCKQNFSAFISGREIFKYLCISSSLLSWMTKDFTYLTNAHKKQIGQMKQKIRQICFSFRSIWKSSKLQKFFEMKLMSVLINYESDQKIKASLIKQYSSELNSNFDKGFTPIIMAITTLMDLIQSDEFSMNTEVEEIVEEYCHRLVENQIFTFVTYTPLLKRFLMGKIGKGKIQQCFVQILDIIQFITCNSCFIKLNLFQILYQVYEVLLPKLTNSQSLSVLQLLSQTSSISYHSIFLKFYLFKSISHLFNAQQTIKFIIKTIIFCPKMDRLYQRIILSSVFRFSIKLSLYKNQKQKRIFLRRKDEHSFGSDQYDQQYYLQNVRLAKLMCHRKAKQILIQELGRQEYVRHFSN